MKRLLPHLATAFRISHRLRAPISAPLARRQRSTGSTRRGPA